MALTSALRAFHHDSQITGLTRALCRSIGIALLALGMSACNSANANKLNRADLKMVFNESFDEAPSLWHATRNPKGRWKTNYFFSFQDTNDPKGWEARTLAPNKEAEYYGDPFEGMNPFEWKDGVLTIVAKPNPYKADPRTHDLPYLSGLITTEKSFSQKYGYFEARIALPVGKGLWPAFWLLPTPVMQSNGWLQARGYQEIDIMEVIGEPGTVRVTAITDVNGEKIGTQQAVETGTDLTQFHNYGVMLTKEEIVWYFDDREVYRLPNRDFHFPAYMLLNLAVGGEWPGYPDSTTKFPAHMHIDWVRAYTFKK